MRHFSFLLFTFLYSFALAQTSPHPLLRPAPVIPDSVAPVPPVYDFRDIDEASHFAATITSERLKFHIDTLAGIYFLGRGMGHVGALRAARYVGGWFYQDKLPEVGDTSYFQKVPLAQEQWRDLTLDIDGYDPKEFRDYFSLLDMNKNQKALSAYDVVFMGYGIADKKYSDYRKKDKKRLKGKTIVIFSGEPIDANGKSWVTGTNKKSAWTNDWRKKLTTAKKYGVKAVLIIDPKTRSYAFNNRYRLERPYFHLDTDNSAEKFANSYYVSQKFAEELFDGDWETILKLKDKISAKGKPKRKTVDSYVGMHQWKRVYDVYGYNALGYIEGSDKRLKNETIIIMANHDHLGKFTDSLFYPGANNNATGTAALIELCHAFNEAKKAGKGPKRSILFVSTTGADANSAGAWHYSSYPYVHLEDAVAAFDLNGIGRTDTLHLTKGSNYTYILGASRTKPEIKTALEEANNRYTKMGLDYTYDYPDEPNGYYSGSDLAPLIEKNVACIKVFGGENNDSYKLTDASTQTDPAQVERVTRLMFCTIWNLANQ